MRIIPIIITIVENTRTDELILVHNCTPNSKQIRGNGLNQLDNKRDIRALALWWSHIKEAVMS